MTYKNNSPLQYPKVWELARKMPKDIREKVRQNAIKHSIKSEGK